MTTITFKQKNSVSGEPTLILNSFTISAEAAKLAQSTKSIYVRVGFMNKTPFISQKGNGANGAGDVISLNITESVEIPVQFNLYERLSVWAEKNNLKMK